MAILTRVWAIGLLLIISTGCADPRKSVEMTQVQSDRGPSKAQAPVDPKTEARMQAVSAELGELADHPWAGEYHSGDPSGKISDRLILAPRSGYVFSMRGRTTSCGSGCPNCAGGGHVTAQGDVVVSGSGALRLAMELSPGEIVLVDDLLPVRWGKRRYLIPVERVSRFCQAVRSGDEPRSTLAGEFLLRGANYTIAVTGLPDLPAPYREALNSNTTANVRVEQRSEQPTGPKAGPLTTK